ncbi:ATP-dependent DNA helicase RecG [bacterium]|nr:ATP-dependent DNA helicase RecG [bacterium]|tara:strand:+ start:17211 stop:19295 length:2085 start_codon:yes stop_codon:yes gene_type:complete
MNPTLKTPVSKLYGVGPSYISKLAKLGIKTAQDLLFHFPHRYEDFSNIKNITDLIIGEKATIIGKILQIKSIRTPRKKMFLTEALIQDKTSAIRAIWFNQPFLMRSLKKGTPVSISGKINIDADSLYFSNPIYEIVFQKSQGTVHTGRLVPIYPETQGLTSRWLRFQTKSLMHLLNDVHDFLPAKTSRDLSLPSLSWALQQIHFPDSEKNAQRAKHRLAFDELFLLQLRGAIARAKWNKQHAPKINFNEKLIKSFVKSLPFKLTNAQKKASWQILRDMEKPHPMNRLLQGDVGSGKTIVSAIAALETANQGLQTAFMAPTEILAEQHYATFKKLFKNTNLKITIHTGSKKQTKKNHASLFMIHNSDIIIGTHALIQEKVEFKNLGLIIVDEQHRFGVKQRAELQRKARALHDNTPSLVPHFLTMTATPIPRTLALSIYNNLDISPLDEMPKGRQKIITKIIAPANRQPAYNFIRAQIKQGCQAFVVCPLIEESESLILADTKAVKIEFAKLDKEIFPDLKIAMLHGRLKPKEKHEIMQDFKAKKYDILVSTSVIEVGIDIENATVMMIESSERFGLAQLHQFRGRVGRGSYQSYCFLFTSSGARATNKRLRALTECDSGFELAEQDLKIRGPGEFLGIRQSGLPDLCMASLTNLKLIEQTKKASLDLLAQDPELTKHALLKNKLKEFKQDVHFE